MSVRSVDLGGIGTFLGGAGTLLGAGGSLGLHRHARHTRVQLEEALSKHAACERRNEELEDRISALETTEVTLRKLLPGGEWYRRLGLDQAD